MRRHKTVLLVLLVAGCLLCAAVALWPREPTCQGRRLSQLLADLDSSPERSIQAFDAVRQMGTNAIPGLLNSLRAKDSWFKASLINLVGAQYLAKLGLVPAQEHRRRGRLAFYVLGLAAKPAIPELIPVLNDGETSPYAAAVLSSLGPEGAYALTNAWDNPDSRVRQAVIRAVECSGLYPGENGTSNKENTPQHPQKVSADLFVPILLHFLEDKDPDVRAPAAEVLGALEAQPERVVPALLKLLRDGELYPRSAAVQALGCFGARAKAAVPALVEYAKRAGSRSERDEAVTALKAIDPEAVIKAELESETGENESVRKKAKVTPSPSQ